MATQSRVSARVAGSDSRPDRTASQCSITSAPTSPSSPRAARPNSSAYLRAAPKISHCMLEGGGRRPVGQGQRAGQREVGRHLVQRAHGVGEREVAGRAGVVLDHGQHDGGAADLQEGGDLGEVGVADDHVQAPEALGVGVRLVARVDDRPLQRRLQPDDLLEELGPLRQLVLHGVRVERRRLRADLARTGEERARHEVRDDAVDHLGERARPGPSCSSRGSRRSCPCRRSCSCRRSGAGWSGMRSAAATMDRRSTSSPALS